MSATLTEPESRESVRGLVDPELYDRLVERIVHDEQINRPSAERAMDEGLSFLRDCAARPDEHLSPTPVADIGWHTFILHTKDYAAFCDRIAGYFIHHVPEADARCKGGKCSQCHAGCHDSP